MRNESLIMEIKKKEELSTIADSVISEVIDGYMKKNNFDIEMFEKLSQRDKKTIIKEIRSILRLSFGRFHSFKKKKNKSNTDIQDLISSHSSTRERLPFYPKLKEIIQKLNPKSILDLACGLNPLVLADKDTTYYACDIDESELNIISDFFKKNNISGKVFVSDIKNLSLTYPQADLCLLLKVLDIIEKKEHKVSRHLLIKLKCKYILVSFATKTLSGKPMKLKRRYWFDHLLNKLNLTYEIFESDNEIFYLIKK